MARKKYKPPKSYITQERPVAPPSVELQIVQAAIKWERALRRWDQQRSEHMTGPMLAGRRRAVKMAARGLRRLTSLLVDK